MICAVILGSRQRNDWKSFQGNGNCHFEKTDNSIILGGIN